MKNNMKTKQERKTNNKKAVSLIVLVITIIVMIILAATIMISLSNNGIIGKAQEAVDQTNLKEVQTLAALKWAEVYMDENITPEQRKEEVLKRINEEKLDLTAYEITVTDNGVTVELKDPNKKENWVVATVDEVPIPKGFVASPYGADEEKGIPAENTRAGGLVIYELTEEEMKKGATSLPEDETQYTSWTTRNQYVWVPVKDLSTNKFERVNWHEGIDGYEDITLSDEPGYDPDKAIFWEITPDSDITKTYDNEYYQICIDEEEGTAEECEGWYGESTLTMGSSQTLQEVTEMYESVEEYGGFYIARYEAGLNVGEHRTEVDGKIESVVYSQMNKAPYNDVAWNNVNSLTVETGGAVEVSRGMYPKTNANYGVVSTLTYGVQWDAVVQWYQDKGIDILDSTNYGNYYNNEIPNSTFNTGASVSKDFSETYTTITSDYSKTNNQSNLLTTGATTEARVNNIYDMAGNLCEWTMEGNNANGRVLRGGFFNYDGGDIPVSIRSECAPVGASNDFGFRFALYIKK